MNSQGTWGALQVRAGTAAYWVTPPLVCLVIYWYGLRAWFQADDFAWLGLRLQIVTGRDLWRILFAPMAQGTIRPWSERAFFLVFQALFGVDALPFRIWVFLTQCANLALLASVTWRLTRSQAAGFWAPVFWTANHGLALAMVWTSAYNQVLCGFFLLAAFYCLLRHIETGERRYSVGQWVWFVLGFGALEINVVYPALAAGYTFLCARKHFRSTLALFVASAIFVVIRMGVAPGETSGPYALHIDRAIPVTLWTYWRWALVPGQLRVSGRWAHAVGPFAVGFLSLALVGFAAWRAARKDWLPVFFLGWFAIVLLPVLPLRDHVSDYYLNLPALGLAMLGAYGLVCAWRSALVWKAAATVLAASYLLLMIPVDRIATRWWYERGASVERMVLGVRRARELHPGKAILLSGVDDALFWTAVFHHPFRVVGVSDVYLTPQSVTQIQPHPDQGRVGDYVLPSGPTLTGLRQGRIVVYAVGGERLKNITSIYQQTAPLQLKAEEPRRVDVGNPYLAYLLGPGWHALEGGYRWMAKRATLRMGGPRSPAERLYLTGYYPVAEFRKGPLPLRLAIEGVPLPEALIPKGDGSFTVDFELSPQWLGKDALDVSVEVGRTFRPPAEGRELGAAFGVFEIR